MANFSSVKIDKDKIRKLFIEKNMTIHDLSKKLNLSEATIYNYFHRGNIRIKTANKIADVLGVKIADIIE